MKHQLRVVLVALGLLAMSAVPALAQNTQIKGTFKGTDGKPMADVQVQMHNRGSGQNIKLKTDKKGEFMSLGVTPGSYDIEFLKDGKTIWKLTNYPVTLQQEMTVIDVDLQKEQAAAAAGGGQPAALTEEQKKEMAKVEAENATIKNLNAMLQQGRA